MKLKIIAVRVDEEEERQLMIAAAPMKLRPSGYLRHLAGLDPHQIGGPRPGSGRKKAAKSK